MRRAQSAARGERGIAVEGRGRGHRPRDAGRRPTLKRTAGLSWSFSLVVGSCVAACSEAPATSVDCHWMGSINPLTGALGPQGLGLENAAKLAVEDINRAGGVGGKKLCVATGDDRTEPDRAAKVAQAMISTYDIRALNGAAASQATLQAAAVAEAHNMAIVSCCSTSPALTSMGNGHIYRTVPSDALQGVALANLALASGAGATPAQNVAVIYDNNSYGTALAETFKTAFVGNGRQVVSSVPFEEKRASYVDVVTRALGVTPAPDHVVLIAYTVEGGQIIRDWKSAGVGQGVKWIGADGLKDSAFALTIGQQVPDFIGTAPNPKGRFYSGFATRYEGAYGGVTPTDFTSNQYDAVILIALGFAAAGSSAAPAAIRSAIPDISRPPGTLVDADDLATAIQLVSQGVDVDYSGVSGEVDLNDSGDVTSAYQVWSLTPDGSSIQETSTCFQCGVPEGGTSVQCTALPGCGTS